MLEPVAVVVSNVYPVNESIERWLLLIATITLPFDATAFASMFKSVDCTLEGSVKSKSKTELFLRAK